MGFSPLKLKNPSLLRAELPFTSRAARDLKDAAAGVIRFTKAGVLLPHHLKKQIQGDKKTTRWIEPGRKEVRETIREQERKHLQTAYDDILHGDHRGRKSSFDLQQAAETVVQALEREGHIPAGSFARFKGTTDTVFVMDTPTNQARRLPENAAAAALCKREIAKAWLQAGLAGDERKVQKAVHAYQSCLASEHPEQKKLQEAANKVIQSLERDGHIPAGSFERFKGTTGTAFVTDRPTNQRLRLPENSVHAALCQAMIGQDWLNKGWVPGANASLDKAVLTVAQAKTYFELPDVKAEAQRQSARVDTAMETYFLLLNGDRPEGAPTTLNDQELGALATGAVFQLQLDGRISRADFDRFVKSSMDDFVGETVGQRLQRFPSNEGGQGDYLRQLLEATIGEAWRRALWAETGTYAPMDTEAVKAWEPLPQEELPPIVPLAQVKPADRPQEPARPEPTPAVPAPAGLTPEQKVAQVNTALATYGFVLVGELPYGATTTLTPDVLDAAAANAMLRLRVDGWITIADYERFIGQPDSPGSFVRESREQRAQRFLPIPADATPAKAAQLRTVNEMCAVAIGQEWAKAFGVSSGLNADISPAVMKAWNESGVSKKPGGPVAPVETVDAAAVPPAPVKQPVAPISRAQPSREEQQQIQQVKTALHAYEAGVRGVQGEGSGVVVLNSLQREKMAGDVVKALDDNGWIAPGAHRQFAKPLNAFLSESSDEARDKRLPTELPERMLTKAAIGQAWIDRGLVQFDGAQKGVHISRDMVDAAFGTRPL